MNEETMKIGMEAMQEKFGDEAMKSAPILAFQGGESALFEPGKFASELASDLELRTAWVYYVENHLKGEASRIGEELVKRGYEYDAEAEHWRRWDDARRKQEVFESVAQAAYEKATGTDFASKIAALRKGEPKVVVNNEFTITEERKPNRLMRWFNYEKRTYPEEREASKPFHDLAKIIDEAYVESAEKTTALRKLMEAQECIIRAAIEQKEDA